MGKLIGLVNGGFRQFIVSDRDAFKGWLWLFTIFNIIDRGAKRMIPA